MSDLRFVVGETAIYVINAGGNSGFLEGEQVCIDQAGPFVPGSIIRCPCGCGSFPSRHPFDYIVTFPGGHAACWDFQLRKIDPPADLASLTRESECGVEA